MIQKTRDVLLRAIQNPWFAYGTIFLLQLKIVWGVWLFRDLTRGDTSYYFLTAYDWYHNWHLLMTWSPLYTSFYGTMLYMSTDAYAATIAHRLITVLALSLLVLALMRRLLPSALAWLVTAWWVVLPIDFDALYEVHLFAVLPVVVAFLAILCKPGPWGRGFGVATLLASAFLMRNELLLATLLFAAFSIGWDLRRKSPGWKLAYGIPIAAACLLILLFYTRSNDGAVRAMLERKHTLNICQTFAFGYQQRSSDWKGSPWNDCQQLMTQVYGVPEPSLTEALRRNPSAMLEHFWWNLQLVPNGIQVLLFNSMSGSITPDYIPSPSGSVWLTFASLITLAIVGVGVVILWRDRRYWWQFWLKDRMWAWLAMGCVSAVTIVVVVTQRPRPSYMFSFGIVLRAAFGICLFAIVSRFPQIRRLASATPVAFVLLILFTPCYYYAASSNKQRPLLDIYRRLEPFRQRIEQPGAGLVVIGWAPELCNYLSKSRGCIPLDFRDLRREVSSRSPWDRVLDDHGATLFYADKKVLADASVGEFVAHAASYGWQVAALHSEPAETWAVLERTSSHDPSPRSTPEIIAPESGVTFGKGWHDIETYPGGQFRWVNNDAELIVKRADPGPVSLRLEVEPGPSLDGKPLAIHVFGDGQQLQTANALVRQTVSVELPSGQLTVRLHVDSVNRPVPHDWRILNFRVFRVTIR